MKSLLVYCGSSEEVPQAFRKAARDLGRLMAERGLHLVYGGGRTGLMGVIADAVMEQGGKVTGIIPKAMAELEVAHDGITQLHVVENMHERKRLMLERADATLALPGGIGTLEEWAEAITWFNLGYHFKPCGLLNVDGFYDHLFKQLERMRDDGFLREAWFRNIVMEEDAGRLLGRLLGED